MENKGLRHYQQEAIQKVIPLIHQESRILISMPTGTGKSFTIINIVYEYYQRRGGVKEEKILFLVDRSVVADSIKRLALEKFDSVQVLYLQPIITQYFIDNKSEIWLLFLIAHSKR